jgi:hypothetical protein
MSHIGSEPEPLPEPEPETSKREPTNIKTGVTNEYHSHSPKNGLLSRSIGLGLGNGQGTKFSLPIFNRIGMLRYTPAGIVIIRLIGTNHIV